MKAKQQYVLCPKKDEILIFNKGYHEDSNVHVFPVGQNQYVALPSHRLKCYMFFIQGYGSCKKTKLLNKARIEKKNCFIKGPVPSDYMLKMFSRLKIVRSFFQTCH